MIESILFFLGVFVIILFCHESGHYLIHWFNGRTPRFQFTPILGVTFNISPYNKWEFDSATATGIIYGLLPFFVLRGFISFSQMIILLSFYLLGCGDDFLKLLGKKKDEDTRETIILSQNNTKEYNES